MAARGASQQAAKILTIGYLGPTTLAVESQRVAAFVQRLRELGWSEGRNLAIEYRWAEGRSERFSEIAAEFVRLKVDVIVTYATPPVIAAKQATSLIPIVFAVAGDPVPRTITWSTHSRQIDPISLSAKPFCQGEPAAIGLSRMPMARNRQRRQP